MRYLLPVLLLLLPNGISAQKLTAYADFAQFQVPGGSAYVEIYLKIPAPRLHFVEKKDTGWQATLEITLMVTEGTKVVYANKYDLQSPGVNEFFRDFSLVDLKRVALEPGIYDLVVEVRDRNHTDPAYIINKNLEVLNPGTPPSFSDVVIADTILPYQANHTLMKHNLLIFPVVRGSFGQDIKQGFFYTEVYPAPPDSIYLLRYYLKKGDERLEHYSGKMAIRGSQVMIANSAFPLEGLEPGHYQLMLELQNTKGNLLQIQQKPFSITQTEAFKYHKPNLEELKVLGYILIPRREKDKYQKAKQLIAGKDSAELKKLLMEEWTLQLNRTPQYEWNEFFERLEYVNGRFGTSMEAGYLTDRGRVYLQYGPPHSVALYPDEPAAYPYELWHYYRMERQSNKRFVFYNPTQLPDEFVLLHSDAQGERNNPQWRKMIYSRTNKNNDLDERGSNTNYGSYLDRFWND